MGRPILILSDNPTTSTGLARETRELGWRIQCMPEFRLGTYGMGGIVSRSLPWYQQVINGMDGWTIPGLPKVWEDFAGREGGIILTIWNASWLHWLVRPEILSPGPLKDFLIRKRFEVWAYIPVDSHGPGGVLSEAEGRTIAACDRFAAYTRYGAEVIDRTLEFIGAKHEPCASLPHGTDQSIFKPKDRGESRRTFASRIAKQQAGEIDPSVFLIGVNATNTARKDWPLAFETLAILRRRGMRVGMAAHTNALEANWNLPAMADMFGLKGSILFTTTNLTDEEMSWWYSACDVTLGIGSGEGWGLPLSESLACGVPALTVDYAGATEFVAKSNLIPPDGWRYDGFYTNKRPTCNPKHWAAKIERLKSYPDKFQKSLDESFYWDGGVWDSWQKWLLEGLK